MDKNIKNINIEIPLVSVMVTTYNRGGYIKDAIKSILDQTYSKLEIIIVDDASTDNTTEIVREFAKNDNRIKYFKQEKNVGISKNRNTALEIAQGKYLAVLDSDDVWCDKEKISKQVNFLENNNDYIIIGSNLITIDENSNKLGEIIYETKNDSIRNKMLARNQLGHSSVIYRLDIIKKIGGYDPAYSMGIEDYDLWLKIGKIGKMANLKESTTYYRIHNKGISKTKKTLIAKKHLEIIKKYKHDYPNFYPALIKAYLRILLSSI